MSDVPDPDKIKWTSGVGTSKPAEDVPDPEKVKWVTSTTTAPVPQAAPAAPGETSLAGMLTEGIKGIGRGAASFPQSIADVVQGKSGLIQNKLEKIPWTDINAIPPEMRLTPNKAAGDLWAKFKEQIKPNPNASRIEQAVGTTGELGAAILPFGAKGAALPIAGGVVGEQMGGEEGKALGTLAAPFATSITKHMLSPKPSKELEMLVRGGVNPTPGQAIGGAANKLEEFPLIREVTGSARMKARDQFVNATINRAVQPLNPSAKITENGTQGFDKAFQMADDAYSVALNRIGNLKVDTQLFADLRQARLSTKYQPARREFQQIMNNVFPSYFQRQATGASTLSASDMKGIDSELGRLIRSSASDPSMRSKELNVALRNAQTALRDMVERQAPDSGIKAANSAWANLVRVETAINKAAATNGMFSPQQFSQAVKETASTRHAFARGHALMQDWAQAGVKVLGNDPNPHIPYALLKNFGLVPLAAGGAAIGGSLGVPLAIGAGSLYSVYNPVTQSLLANSLVRRPNSIRALGNALPGFNPAALGALPLFTQGEE